MDNLSETFVTIWDFLVEHKIATDDELSLACGLLGESVNTLDSVIFYKTGYRDFNQLYEYEFIPAEIEIPF